MEFHRSLSGNILKSIRYQEAISMTDLAARAAVHRNTIRRAEKGENVTIVTAHKISKALKLPIDYLLSPQKDSQVILALEPINKEIIEYLARHPKEMYSLSPRKFEYLIAELLKDMGGEIKITPETRDGGRDILAAFNTPIGQILTIVECKKWSPESKVGLDIVERFLWTIEQKDRASCGLIATTSYFSPDAVRLQTDYSWRIKLRDFDGLKQWLSQYGKWSHKEKYGLWLPEIEAKSPLVLKDSKVLG